MTTFVQIFTFHFILFHSVGYTIQQMLLMSKSNAIPGMRKVIYCKTFFYQCILVAAAVEAIIGEVL